MAADAAAPVGADEARRLLAPLADRPSLLVALSGGPDSCALLLLCATVFGGAGVPRVFAATVDHGLRAGSAAEAEAAGRIAVRLGCPHVVLPWTGPKPGTRLMERAREARFGLLAAHARAHGIADVVIAHHADDQAETVLMRLAAGSGPGGLAAMRLRSERDGLVVWRPLLGLPKSRLVATVRAAGLAHADDPSNADPRFARPRLRRAAAVLAAEGLDAARLSRLALRAARAEDALREATDRAMDRHATGTGSFAPGLWREPAEIVLRVLAEAIRRTGGVVPRLERTEHLVERACASARAGTVLAATLGGCRVAVDRLGAVTIRRENPRRGAKRQL